MYPLLTGLGSIFPIAASHFCQNEYICSLDVKVSIKNHDYPHLVPHIYHICGKCGAFTYLLYKLPHLSGNL